MPRLVTTPGPIIIIWHLKRADLQILAGEICIELISCPLHCLITLVSGPLTGLRPVTTATRRSVLEEFQTRQNPRHV